MLKELTSAQLSEWEAFCKLEPIGSWIEDYRMAVLASLIVNSVRAVHGKKGVKMSEPGDFMPKWDEGETVVKRQSVEEMKQLMLAIAGAQNSRVKNKVANKKKQ